MSTSSISFFHPREQVGRKVLSFACVAGQCVCTCVCVYCIRMCTHVVL